MPRPGQERREYDPLPCYRCVGGEVATGWSALVRSLPADLAGLVLAVDGPAVLIGTGIDWPQLAARLVAELRHRTHAAIVTRDIREHFGSWEHIQKATAPVEALRNDPDFATLASIDLGELFLELPDDHDADVFTIVFGPGAALVSADVVWYADLPKRYAEAAIAGGLHGNLGQPPTEGAGTTRRLFYIDWPILDRHRDALAERVDRWIDLQAGDAPASISGAALRSTAAVLAEQPFRTRPTFNTTSWGGHWAQQQLGVNPDAPNTALGYELIAPESGVLIGERDTAFVEVPFQLLVTLQPEAVLGPVVHAQFGTSFPIRFDYLDTVGGGSLSVHCHPREDRMREVFGWPYTQHETYYVMVGGDEQVIYLGLREDADLAEFSQRAHDADEHGVPFDIEQYVQTFPAREHQLFLVPAGTPHGSGVGNVVLEVSATPYLYSLRFYDWLRRDAQGRQRPVHVAHAFDNLDAGRRGHAVAAELVQPARTVAGSDGWQDELLGALPEMFFEVHRLAVDPGQAAVLTTQGRFCVLNVVAGAGALLRWSGGEHPLAYAETIMVPAAVGEYTVHAVGDDPVRLVRAFVT